MRAYGNLNDSLMGAQIQANPVETFEDRTEKKAENIGVNENTPLITWGILTLLYFFWAWIDQQETVAESVKPANVKINFRSMAITTLSVLVFGNLLKILVGKIALSKIPVINKIAQSIVPVII